METEQIKKDYTIYTFEDGKVSVRVENPDTISLITSETLARMKFRRMKLDELLTAWVNKEDLNRLHNIRTQIDSLSEEEFKQLWDQARYWTLNVYHSELTPTFEEFFRSRILPSEEIVGRQNFWKRLIVPAKMNSASPEQIEKLQKLRDREINSHVIQNS